MGLRMNCIPGAGGIVRPPCDAPPADLSLLNGLPLDGDGPVFRAPWEAQAFGMALALHERGLFTWDEWAQALAAQIRAAQAQGDPDLGNTYYCHWLAAIESLVSTKGASSLEELGRYRKAWLHAAGRVPHGQPIALREGDFAG